MMTEMRIRFRACSRTPKASPLKNCREAALVKSTESFSESLHGVQVLNKQRRFSICGSAVALYCVRVIRALSCEVPALSIVFVNQVQMRGINNTYLRHDYATDVLSFSYDGTIMEGRPFLGEIVIAPEIAAFHAARYGISPEMEVRKLLVHGILHLMGYNHETDQGQMKRLQTRLLRRKLLSTAFPLHVIKETP
jgi:probable rRNA maturation factor